MNSFYGPGSGRIWLDGVHCDGTEESLVWCSRSEWGITKHSHIKDVSINCLPGLLTALICPF